MAEWNTEVTSIKENEILVRGYPIEQLMEKTSFSDAVYLILKGELPGAGESRIFGAILTSSLDHGVTPPSVLATLNSTSTGAPLNAAVASGILSINRFHGGAVEDAMKMLMEAAKATGGTADRDKIHAFVEKKLAEEYRFPGLGHRVHTADPRSIKMKALVEQHLDAKKRLYVDIACLIEEEIEKIKGKKLPVNVDGMIGALLLGLEFPPEIANGIFMISRVPGLIAHFVEERKTQKPMRNIDQKSALYTGKPKRNIE